MQEAENRYVQRSVHIAINQLKYRLRSSTMENIACGHGLEANIELGFALCYIASIDHALV